MKVYELDFDGSGDWVSFFTSDKVVIGDYSSTNKLFSDGIPIRIERNEEATPKGSKARLGDFSNVNYSPYPCFSARAKSLIEKDLLGLGHWLELECDEATYWLFNIVNIVDAIDEATSIIKDLGSVKSVKEFGFRTHIVDNQILFKITQRPGSYNLVTEKFVELVRQNQLTGFLFRLLWSSEEGPVSAKLKDYERPRITGLEP